jgi:hypothetical protein
VTLQHAVFTGCKLDYATRDQVRAAGPVIFAGCSQREAEFTGCDLAPCSMNATFAGCSQRVAADGRISAKVRADHPMSGCRVAWAGGLSSGRSSGCDP